MRSLILACFILFSSLTLQAQIVDVPSKSGSKIKEGLSGEVEASSFIYKGNSEVDQVGLNAGINYRDGQHAGIFQVKRAYAESRGEPSMDSSFQHARYRFYLEDYLALDVFGEHSRDVFKALNSRVVYGAGPWVKITDHWTAGVLIMQEKEIYVGKGYEINNRFSNYVSFKYKTDRWELSQTLYHQPKMHKPNLFTLYDPDDVRMLSETSGKYQLLSSLYVKMTLTVSQDTSPPKPEMHDVDTSVITSLVLHF